MKLLWLSHFVPYPPRGGLLQRSYNLLIQAARRHEVHLVSMNQKSITSTQEVLEEALEKLKKVCTRVDVFPVKTDGSKLNWTIMTMLSYFSSFPYDVNWLYNKDMFIFLEKLSGEERYDLIHVDTNGMLQYASPFLPIPVVLNHHNIESHMMLRRYKNEIFLPKKIYFKKESIKLKKYELNNCKKYEMNLVVSDLDSSRLIENVGDVAITVVTNGVDINYFRPQKPVDINTRGLIFIGAMDWYPNREAVLFFLSEIWPKLTEEKYVDPITIIGRNPPTQLLSVAKHSKIVAPGFVEDVRPYMDSSKIYICPIKEGGGTRLKILDALAMRKPLVATGLAVEGLDLVEEEHFLRAESASEFVAQIKRLENNSDLCYKIAHEGRRFVEERYSWEIIGKKLDEAYREAICNFNNKKRE